MIVQALHHRTAEGKLPERKQVPEDDQGIDWDQQVRPGVYVLEELSSGEAITDDGEPVYVDESGNRVQG